LLIGSFGYGSVTIYPSTRFWVIGDVVTNFFCSVGYFLDEVSASAYLGDLWNEGKRKTFDSFLLYSTNNSLAEHGTLCAAWEWNASI
jgi:hypothetical protein